MTKDLENQIRQCTATPAVAPDRAAFEQTLWLARKELQIKSCRQRILFSDFLILQIKYTGTRIWLIQAVLLTFSVSALWTLYRDLFFLTPRRTAILLCTFAMMIFLATIPFIHRSQRYRMAEMEAATRFSATYLLLARVIIIGAGDLAIIVSIVRFTTIRTHLDIGSALLYLIVPFLTACFTGLYLSRHVKITHFPLCCGGICLSMGGFILFLNHWYPQCFEQTFSPQSALVCAMLLLLCAQQLRRLVFMPVRV